MRRDSGGFLTTPVAGAMTQATAAEICKDWDAWTDIPTWTE